MFLLNLGLTSSATLFHGNPSVAVICTSTGIAFVIFVGIISYHIQRQIFLSRFGKKLKKELGRFRLKRNIDREVTNADLQVCSLRQVTHTIVELTEPLLESREDVSSQGEAINVE